MPVIKQSVRLFPAVAAEVDRRGDQFSTQLNRMISRYADLMARGRRELRAILSDQELGLILDACNGTAFMDSVSIQLVGAGVADAIGLDGLDGKWDVDGDALVAKLQALTYAQRLAPVDAVQTWWNRVGNGEAPAYGEALDWPDGQGGEVL